MSALGCRTSKDYGELAKLKTIGSRNPSQKIGAMFHMGEDLLAALNPGVDLSKAGTTILVAEVKPQPILGTLKTIVVDKKKSQMLGYDRKGHVLVAYPADDRQPRASLTIGHLQGQGRRL
jgi:lipoprotein-anchoring transpeptidase ErfK/SrfK